MNVSLRLRYNQATVLFNDTAHLVFLIDRFVGLQTWTPADRFCLEITLKDGVITTEYDSFDKFSAVLRCIDEALA